MCVIIINTSDRRVIYRSRQRRVTTYTPARHDDKRARASDGRFGFWILDFGTLQQRVTRCPTVQGFDSRSCSASSCTSMHEIAAGANKGGFNFATLQQLSYVGRPFFKTPRKDRILS